MNEIINVNIRNEDGKLLVRSRDIAAGLEKEHKHVLSKIREVLNGSEFCPVEYSVTNRNPVRFFDIELPPRGRFQAGISSVP